MNNRKENIMKKVIQILLICLIIAGIIVISTIGFNVGTKYAENTQINIYIGSEFKIEDIRSITDEVFGNTPVFTSPLLFISNSIFSSPLSKF